MLTDPQSVTINATPVSLPRVSTRANGATYANSDGSVKLDVNQLNTKNRFRREFRLTQTKVAADPLTAENQEVSTSIIFVVDEPRNGFTDAELGYLIDAVKTAYSSEQYNKVLGGES
jgi:hypothetical protein